MMREQRIGMRRVAALLATAVLSSILVIGCGDILGSADGEGTADEGGTPPAAQPVALGAILRGSQEVPAVNTAASGTAIVTVSGDRQRIDVNLQTQGLTNVTAAHIHIGALGVNGPIILTLFDAQTEGAFTGSVVRTLTAANLEPRPAQGINTFADAVNALLSGATYVNAHTQANPGGEIRGQLTP